MLEGFGEGNITVRDSVTLEPEGTGVGHEDGVVDLAADGAGCVVSSSLDLTVRVWRVQYRAGKPGLDPCRILSGYGCSVVTSLCLRDGLLFTGSKDGRARLHEVDSGQLRQVVVREHTSIDCCARRSDSCVT